MDEQQVEKVVDRSVRTCLVTIGFDLSKPTEIQEDVAFLRRLRKLWESAGTKAVMVIVGVVVIAVLGGLLVALGNALNV
jgi:RNase P/RNase MRP subunit p30